MSSAEERLRKLEQLYLNGVAKSSGLALSVETLLDVFLVLYDECSSSTLRREKNISEFVEFGKLICHWCQLRCLLDLGSKKSTLFSLLGSEYV